MGNPNPGTARQQSPGLPSASLSNPDDATKKRELRLLKNREAAKECRRKKKEYIKCLENRVAVLENQNKALIEELKSLKELYCSKGDWVCYEKAIRDKLTDFPTSPRVLNSQTITRSCTSSKETKFRKIAIRGHLKWRLSSITKLHQFFEQLRLRSSYQKESKVECNPS